MTHAELALLNEFETLQISATDFHHEDHVRVALTMLNKYEFLDACSRFAKALMSMAQGAGAPEKYNATITFAFMSVIAERKACSQFEDTESFLSTNPDLLRKEFLSDWYSKARMTSAMARSQFLLPDKPMKSRPVQDKSEAVGRSSGSRTICDTM